jgi:uncharacterized protein YjbI with pentapeptide repeats
LQNASLQRADLQGVNLHEAVIVHTIFTHTNLSGVTGLDARSYLAASQLDPGTLAQSDPFPAVFLQGCEWDASRTTP